MAREAHEIMAAALESAAECQVDGDASLVTDLYDPTYGRILELGADRDEPIGFAFRFWDDWVDAVNASRGELAEEDWPRLAQRVAEALRRGELPADRALLERFRSRPRPSLWARLKDLFGGTRADEADATEFPEER